MGFSCSRPRLICAGSQPESCLQAFKPVSVAATGRMEPVEAVAATPALTAGADAAAAAAAAPAPASSDEEGVLNLLDQGTGTKACTSALRVACRPASSKGFLEASGGASR